MTIKKYTYFNIDKGKEESESVNIDDVIDKTFVEVKSKIDKEIERHNTITKKQDSLKTMIEESTTKQERQIEEFLGFRIKQITIESDEFWEYVYENRFRTNEYLLDVFTEVIDKLKIDGYQLSKQRYLSILIMNLDYCDSRTRTRVRDIINSNKIISSDEYLSEYQTIYEDTKDEKWKKVNHFEYERDNEVFYYLKQKIINDDWITVYRGFNTREEENIRLSNNKNKSDYFRQKEGMGFSFSLSKYVALAFSSKFHIQQMEDYLKNNFDIDKRGLLYKDLHKEIMWWREKFYKNLEYDFKLDKEIGRITIGRYVIHQSNIFAFNDRYKEQEIMCDYRDAKLIDYKFLSDNKQFSVDMFKVDHQFLENYRFEFIKQDKTLWINNNWKNSYKVSEELESLF